jgi:hypothetical protein
MLELKTKEDIEYHGTHFDYNRQPAVNVKVYDSLPNGFTRWEKDIKDHDAEFTLDWIEQNVSDEYLENIFWATCELGWETLEDEARNIWGRDMFTDRYGARKYRVHVYSAGRSGGWAYVDGADMDVDSWDAIEFSKWKRFARFARAEADGIMWSVVDWIYENLFFEWKDERSEDRAPDFPEGSNDSL